MESKPPLPEQAETKPKSTDALLSEIDELLGPVGNQPASSAMGRAALRYGTYVSGEGRKEPPLAWFSDAENQ